MEKATGNYRDRIRRIRDNLDNKEFAKKIGYCLRMVEGWQRGEFAPTERACSKISISCNYNYLWIMKGEGEPYPSSMVATGITEETFPVAGTEEAPEGHPCISAEDRILLKQWLEQDEAWRLYRLTQEEVRVLGSIPIRNFEDATEKFADIYRRFLLATRDFKLKRLKEERPPTP